MSAQLDSEPVGPAAQILDRKPGQLSRTEPAGETQKQQRPVAPVGQAVLTDLDDAAEQQFGTEAPTWGRLKTPLLPDADADLARAVSAAGIFKAQNAMQRTDGRGAPIGCLDISFTPDLMDQKGANQALRRWNGRHAEPGRKSEKKP